MKLNNKILFKVIYNARIIYSLLFLLISSSVTGQEFLKNIEGALKTGKTKELSIYFDKYIDLSFSEKTNVYSKKQAEVIIQSFFTKIEPKDFIRVKKGTSHSNNTIYYIGTLTAKNSIYKVYMFFVITNATYVLKELRFEKE